VGRPTRNEYCYFSDWRSGKRLVRGSGDGKKGELIYLKEISRALFL
jgi:hypothetical protein